MIKQLLYILLVTLITSCSQNNSAVINHERIKIETDSIFYNLVELRRDFHKYPEIAKEEKRTKEVIKNQLLKLGLEVITDTYGNSIIGILKGGKPGKNIAWRADMDAIPHKFPNDATYRSTVKGVQHACGHDIHMTIALGIAEIFAKYKNSINGNVYFLFQPEEETFLGAKGMVENGLFSTIELDEIYAAHVTAFDVGKIVVKPNEIYAYQKRIQISFDKSIDKNDVFELYDEIKALMTRRSPESAPWDITTAFNDQQGVSNSETIFEDYCFMDDNAYIVEEENALNISTNLYETDSTRLDSIIPKIESLIKNSKYRNLLYSISFIQENPTVLNPIDLTNESIQTLSTIYSQDLIEVSQGQLPYFNDDFCYFQKEIPGVYFLLGGSNNGKGIFALNHGPNFQVDEECIRVGVRSFSSLILERLNKE